MFQHDLFHGLGLGAQVKRGRQLALVFGDVGQLVGSQHKQPANEDRFGHLAIFIGGGLERLPRGIREAVEVQAVIPIGAPDQGQAVRADAFEGVSHAAL